MSSEFYFDPEQQEGSNFELIPAGDYVAQIVEVDIRQPKSGDGHMLAFTWKICDGEYENRQIWQTLCYQHSNTQTQDIARKMLKDICVALGITEHVTDPEVFKFKPARVRISIEVDKYGQYDDQNRIKRVRPLTEADAEAAEAESATAASSTPKPSPAKPAPKPTTNGPGAAPWKRPTA